MTDREAIDVLFNEWKCIDRNDGIHCDRKCESCDLVMDVGIIREAFNMAISALQAQELSKNSPKLDKGNGDLQPTCNKFATDTISRQDAIDALMDFDKKLRKINWYQYPHTEYECRGVDEAIVKIENVPSAQPQIIRCRDCKYWREHKYAKETKRYIPFCGYNAIYTKSDDFCSKAERRTDG